MAAMQAHQVIIVCGETGSGKTTQLPKICLDLGIGARGLIGHTQPRRLAALFDKLRQRFGQRGLGRTAMATPAGAKFEQGQATQSVHIGAAGGFNFTEVRSWHVELTKR